MAGIRGPDKKKPRGNDPHKPVGFPERNNVPTLPNRGAAMRRNGNYTRNHPWLLRGGSFWSPLPSRSHYLLHKQLCSPATMYTASDGVKLPASFREFVVRE